MSINLLKISSVSKKLDCSRNTIRKMIRDGLFPEGIGEGKDRRWLEPEVDFYIARYFNLEHSYFQKSSELLDLNQKIKIEKMVNKNREINACCMQKQLETINSGLNKREKK